MTAQDRPVEPVLESAYAVYTRTKARGTDPAAGLAFDPTASPLHGKAVFLMGAPRSGTTWLQQLLVLHPQIATAGETHVFCEGVGALLKNHDEEDRYSGLSGWVTRPELVGLIRELVDGVMLRMRDTSRPDATHVLDKTPNHIPYAGQVAETHPDAAFIQIIRDGRESAASAHDLWSWSDAYGSHRRNAARWRDAILDCRTHLSRLRYCEVRYEDLLNDTVGELARVYDLIGLPYDEAFLARSAEFGQTPVNVRPSRPGVSSRKWAGTPAYAQREMLLEAGELMVELGYLDAKQLKQGLRRRPLSAAGAALRRPRRDKVSAKAQRQRLRTRAQALAAAVSSADQEAVAGCLAADARMRSGAGLTRGKHEVAEVLVEQLRGSQLLAVDADQDAATLRWGDGNGGHRLLQLTLDDASAVAALTVTGN